MATKKKLISGFGSGYRQSREKRERTVMWESWHIQTGYSRDEDGDNPEYIYTSFQNIYLFLFPSSLSLSLPPLSLYFFSFIPLLAKSDNTYILLKQNIT